MQGAEKVDANFVFEKKIVNKDIRFYDANCAPFEICGVFYEGGKFRRIPEAVAKTVNEGVYTLHTNTAGGRVRFKTNSSLIAIRADMPIIGRFPHFTLSGAAGFDIYMRDTQYKYMETFVPLYDMTDGFEGGREFEESGMREITINFPLYSDVSKLCIGICADAELAAPDPYNGDKPIVFYGSSITQGGCASRPGNAYESIISRRYHMDYVNLGFSGNAKGEDTIAEYISKLKMSVFVYDYDHNAPTVEHLEKTHEKMFRTVRDANPDLPIVMMSRPVFYPTEEEKKRLEIVKRTYENAKLRGDKNVYFIDGKTLMALAGNDGTVDNCHPNDLGFASMAAALGKVLDRIFKA